MAAAYGQPPDHFDDWPLAQMERELEIYQAIRQDGDYPLSTSVFAEFMLAEFGGGE